MNDLEKYIGQKRIWISPPDGGFSEKFLNQSFTISGIKTDMSNLLYFTYYYRDRSSDNKRHIEDILNHSVELSPVLKELFDVF
jgi:hypothetical protein